MVLKCLPPFVISKGWVFLSSVQTQGLITLKKIQFIGKSSSNSVRSSAGNLDSLCTMILIPVICLFCQFSIDVAVKDF